MESSFDYPWWDDRSNISSKLASHTVEAIEINHIFSSPRSIFNYFDSKIYGNEQYKKSLSTAIWSSLKKDIKSNFLVTGPSGTGKTELARVLSAVYGNTVIFDASNVSPQTYRGSCTMSSCLENIDATQPSFIFIDEFDKALARGETGSIIENEILKMLEGTDVFVGESNNSTRKIVNTSKCNFIFLGTFAHLNKGKHRGMGFNAISEPSATSITKQELIDSRVVSNEFLGRLNEIITLDSITDEQVLELLSEPRYSPITKLSQKYGINLQVTPDTYHELASMTSQYGMRGIYSEITTRINDALFEDASIKELTI